MDELVKETFNNGNPLPEFNNAAEDWNHDFFWESMQPGGVWLVLKREERRLEILKTSNAICPIVWDDIPLVNLDLWEHACYLDYKVRNNIHTWWNSYSSA
ncbi:hypothetical protein K1719_000182 [Acacia pycnantha]|nr:hypothetical protein K1719_000182 [Acacia pycnantha]